MIPALNTYYVYFDTWCSLGRAFMAENEDQAIQQAENLFNLEGEKAFQVIDAGSESFDVFVMIGYPTMFGFESVFI